MKMVEITFIKNFSNSNYTVAMKLLKPKTKSEKHSVTFSSGYFIFFMKLLLKSKVVVNECLVILRLISFAFPPYFQGSYLVVQWHYLWQLF